MSFDMQDCCQEPLSLSDNDSIESEHTFEVYVDDSRYSVPTLYLIAADEAGAIEAARKMVSDSPHHLGAELRLDGLRLIGFGSLAANDDAAE
jgi:hypothetical protein